MKKNAFSIIELIVVVVVLGVLAALAIPRLSQGAVNQSESDLRAGLAVLRTAIEMYHDDHEAYPAQRSAGTVGAEAGTTAALLRQLTQYTNAAGHARATPGDAFSYGPYLRNGVPPSPVSTGQSSALVHLIAGQAKPAFDSTTLGTSWIYNYETGYIAANSDDQDALGRRYDSY
jgi:general secretion pathway protein G